MSDVVVMRDGARAVPGRWRALTGRATVLGFWWLATGALVAMQRTPALRVVAALASTVGAGFGAALIIRNRQGMSSRQLLASFHGGALVWLWVATMLYGGWIVGIPLIPPAAGAPRTWELAFEAIGATLYNDVLGVACVVACAWMVRGAPNKGGAWSIVSFWAAHQLAKLNLFMGVAYPGADFLPSYLSHLANYFGTASNSPLLYLTIAGLGLLGAVLVVRMHRERDDGSRMLMGLLATLVFLMLLEHTWLGVGSGAALWTLFLSARAA